MYYVEYHHPLGPTTKFELSKLWLTKLHTILAILNSANFYMKLVYEKIQQCVKKYTYRPTYYIIYEILQLRLVQNKIHLS